MLIVDKKSFPRPKVCGACLNGAGLQVLESIGLGELPARLGGVRLDGVRLGIAGRLQELPLPRGVAVSRSRFDEALAAAAVDAGACFLSRRPGLDRRGDGRLPARSSDPSRRRDDGVGSGGRGGFGSGRARAGRRSGPANPRRGAIARGVWAAPSSTSPRSIGRGRSSWRWGRGGTSAWSASRTAV